MVKQSDGRLCGGIESLRDDESIRFVQDWRWTIEFAHDGADAGGVPVCA